MSERITLYVLLGVLLITAVVFAVLYFRSRANGCRQNCRGGCRKNELLQAIHLNQFEPYLQFVYDISDDRLSGCEVLSRWNHPVKGLLMPSQFIADMREEGIVDILDFRMLDRACALLEQWEKNGNEKLRLSCNFTRISLSAEDFSQRFHETIEKYHFDHSRLTIEITEDALFEDRILAYQNIMVCRDNGIGIALDDLGAGFSSFRDLADFPVDYIKIDRHLTIGLSTERGRALMRGIVELAHQLGIKVLCEGVETEQERSAAVESGCDYIQGFYYSRVNPIDVAMEHYKQKLMPV